MIQRQRIQVLRDLDPPKRRYVLYWMQASQRAEYNHALEYAILTANEYGLPLLVYFGVTPNYPRATARHYRFMLEGLEETRDSLTRRGIGMAILAADPPEGALTLSKDASMVVTDRGFTRLQREWRRALAETISCPLIQVETDVVVPAEEASVKEEYSAATFRPKISKMLPGFLVPLKKNRVKKDSLAMEVDSLGLSSIDSALDGLGVDRSIPDTGVRTRGGTGEAKKLLSRFFREKLTRYGEERNDPSLDGTSQLSPYLHFGQISPLYVALRVMERNVPGGDAFLEELIVRRELAVNFTLYNPVYDTFECLPEWARKTLKEHEKDRRDYIYSARELEGAFTHDPYWNAAQREMIETGRMHGYMRMYWGKKILEWTDKPEEAYRIALMLNDSYQLDGRDPNGYAGVAWCFGKHDRPWKERPIFGKVRYMNDRGLERKFDIDAYARKWGAVY